jgi:nitrite reductase/ring-hydroxylating ferredoxin subunit
MERKEFIKNCSAACLGLVGFAIILESCTGTKNIQAATVNGKLVLLKKDFLKNDKPQRYVIVRTDALTYPVVVYRFSESEYKALLLQCSHQGMELSVTGDLLSCNAHGSEFNNKGEVVQGPAEQNLKHYPVTHDNENIYIHLTMIRLFIFLLVIITCSASSQQDTSLFKRVPVDTGKMKMNMDAVYNRPFLQTGKMPVALGGYLEGNSSYFVTNGITEGLSFQLPRLTIFMSSTIKKKIKFLTEVELEEGGREINIEFASMDIELHPMMTLRGGVIMNPIGSFNQNHDGPKWEFISRPISATEIIPSTCSNVGFGVFGKFAKHHLVWAYEVYLTNGFDDQIIANQRNRTWLGASKNNPERFGESNNGVPLVTAKTAFRHRKIGEIGLSWMGGIYNKFSEDGIMLDEKRRVDVFAVDFNSTLPTRTYINGELVMAMVEVPSSYSQQFGNKQQGGFVDIVQPVIRRKILGWENSTINLALRTEYVDYNVGTFKETGDNISDHIFAVVPGISFRPSQQTVIRFNYRYHLQTDLLGNPAARTGGIQFGFSTYF